MHLLRCSIPTRAATSDCSTGFKIVAFDCMYDDTSLRVMRMHERSSLAPEDVSSLARCAATTAGARNGSRWMRMLAHAAAAAPCIPRRCTITNTAHEPTPAAPQQCSLDSAHTAGNATAFPEEHLAPFPAGLDNELVLKNSAAWCQARSSGARCCTRGVCRARKRGRSRLAQPTALLGVAWALTRDCCMLPCLPTTHVHRNCRPAGGAAGPGAGPLIQAVGRVRCAACALRPQQARAHAVLVVSRSVGMLLAGWCCPCCAAQAEARRHRRLACIVYLLLHRRRGQADACVVPYDQVKNIIAQAKERCARARSLACFAPACLHACPLCMHACMHHHKHCSNTMVALARCCKSSRTRNETLTCRPTHAPGAAMQVHYQGQGD